MAIKALGDIVNVISEHISNPSTSGYNIFVGLEHYDSGEPVITRFGSTEQLESSVKHFQKGDILVARRNVYLKRAGVVNFEGVTSGDSIVLRIKEEQYKEIIPFILNTEDFWDYAEQNSDGTMSKRLAPDVLLEYECNIPDNHQKIAEKLWAAYKLKEAYKKMIFTTDEMVKSQFIEMFTNRKWEEAYLEDVVSDDCSLSYGIVQPGEGVDEGIPVVRPVDLTTKFIEPDMLKRTTNEIANSYKRTSLKGGELLLCVRGTTGIVSIASDRLNGANVTRGIVPVWFKENISRDFMYHLFKSEYIQSQIKDKTCGSTLLQINIKDLRKIRVIIPSNDLQFKFISFAEQADKSKFELRKSIESIDAVIKSLINS